MKDNKWKIAFLHLHFRVDTEHLINDRTFSSGASLPCFPFCLQVNNNGIISFKEKIDIYKPLNFNNSSFKNKIPLIAPFWADVDIKNVRGQNESIVFRLTSEDTVINRASQDVRRYFIGQSNFIAKEVLIVTWFQVGFYGASQDGKNKVTTIP